MPLRAALADDCEQQLRRVLADLLYACRDLSEAGDVPSAEASVLFYAACLLALWRDWSLFWDVRLSAASRLERQERRLVRAVLGGKVLKAARRLRWKDE